MHAQPLATEEGRGINCWEGYIPLGRLTMTSNWNTIGLLQYYYWAPFGYLGNTSVVQNRGNTITIIFCAALTSIDTFNQKNKYCLSKYFVSAFYY